MSGSRLFGSSAGIEFTNEIVEWIPELIGLEIAAIAENDRGPIGREIAIVRSPEAVPQAIVAVTDQFAGLVV